MEECVRRITARADALTPEKAEALARRTNKWRADYYKFFSPTRMWGRADSYDLTLDSSKTGIPGCVEMIKKPTSG